MRCRIVVWIAFVLAGFIAGAYSAYAYPVSQDMAEEVAWYYLRVAPPPDIPGGPDALFRTAYSLTTDWDDRTVGYVFEIDPVGYLVISADTEIEPLIAYSGRTNFLGEKEGANDRNNALLDVLLLDLALRLDAAQADAVPGMPCNEAKWEQIRALSSGSSSSPYVLVMHSFGLFESQYRGTGRLIGLPDDWHQDKPYNDQCPQVPNKPTKRCKTGCVATALAQIIAFHRCPVEVAIPQGTAYKVNGGDRTLNADTAFQFTFPRSPVDNPSSTTSASLCYSTGLSVGFGSRTKGTDYGEEFSGARLVDAATALTGPWTYQSAKVVGLNPCGAVQGTVSSDAFSAELADDLSAGMPALLSLSGASLGRHAVVCDGWEQEIAGGCSTNRFHLRMATDGRGVDSWYDLPIDFPGDYCVLYGIFDIRPPATSTEASYGAAITVDKGCGGIYADKEEIDISFALSEAATADIFDFDPRRPQQPVPILRNERCAARAYSLATASISGKGVETFVIRANTGATVHMAACRVVVDASSSLLDVASVSTQRGCDATFTPGERLTISYSVSASVSGVWLYLVTSEGVFPLSPSPLTIASGTITSNPIGPIRGDRMVVLVATTARGTTAAVCRYTVN